MDSNMIKALIKNMGVKENVAFRVIDVETGKIVQEHIAHNSATNTLLTGIAHYLIGDGVFNQGSYMLSDYIPRYISLGTMGLINQECDEDGLPIGIGTAESSEVLAAKAVYEAALKSQQEAQDAYDNLECKTCPKQDECNHYVETVQAALDILNAAIAATNAAKAVYEAALVSDEEARYTAYMDQRPGYGSDGYDSNLINGRPYFGLGPMFEHRADKEHSVNCELISAKFPRVSIAYREIVPEIKAELPETIDVVYSAMISTGALKQFRESDKDYIFITEAGLWSKRDWDGAIIDNSTDPVSLSVDSYDAGDNGLLAGYRIVPSDKNNWNMSDPANRKKLQQSILRVGRNQVVQVVWKIQLGAKVDAERKSYENIQITSWTEDSTYPGFQYRGDAHCPGVTSGMLPYVIFGEQQSEDEDNYCKRCRTSTDTVSVYSNLTDPITIPTIIVEVV